MSTTPLQPIHPEYASELRIVIAVTGPDMYAAREYLLREILPELKRRCRERGGTLVVIDTDRRGRMGADMFDALAGSRPYLIGLVGRHDEPTSDPDPDGGLRRPYPWLHRGADAPQRGDDGPLIEEIIANPLMVGYAFFYSSCGPDDSSGPSSGDSRAGSQTTAILERIRDSEFALRENCRALETLGGYVREDISAIMEKYLPYSPPDTPLEAERRLHRAFAVSRCREYIANPSYTDRLESYACESPPEQEGGMGLVVTGDSGAGKSALLAYWEMQYRREHPGAFMIGHYLSADSIGADHIPLLRRVMAEIKERYAFDHPLPIDAKEIEQAFPLWLGNVQQENLILVVDGLDQLADLSQLLGWLPEYLQPHLRLIVSTTGGPTLEHLRERGWPELHVSPLRIEERREMVQRYFSTGRHSLSAEQLQRFSRGSWSANPLFLRTRLQEIGRFDASPELNERIDFFLDASDLGDLFQRILLRLESGHDPALVGDLLSLIWASGRGLSEPELVGLLRSSGASLTGLLEDLEHHLLDRGGLLAFFHDQMRAAVEQRYVLDGERSARALHLRLAEYFRTLPAGPRRADEEPWQLQKAMEWSALRDCLADIPMFMALSGESSNYRLLGYWLAIGDRFEPADVYRESFRRYELEHEKSELMAPLGVLGRFFSDAGRYAEAEGCFIRVLALQERLLGPAHADIAVTLDHLAALHYHGGRGAEAIALLRRALEIRERNLQPEHLSIARNLADLGAGLYAVGEFDEAERHLAQALTAGDRQGREGLPIVAMILNNLGALRVATARYDAAITYFERAERINEFLFGPEHPEVASNLVNHAYALQEQGCARNAEELYRRALAISEKALGPDHPQVAIVLTNLGALRRDDGDLDEAGALFTRALTIRVEAFGRDHLETLDSMKRLGYVLKLRGEYAQARLLYQETMAGYRKLYGPSHPDVEGLRKSIREMPRAG